MHICDTPACVNPKHLKLGTIADNNRDRSFKNRNRDQAGTKNNMAKLNDEGVCVIRYLYLRTDLSHSQIAEIFKVSRPTISVILENKAWRQNESQHRTLL
jgi:predicted XRE-type DNA-binding protein